MPGDLPINSQINNSGSPLAGGSNLDIRITASSSSNAIDGYSPSKAATRPRIAPSYIEVPQSNSPLRTSSLNSITLVEKSGGSAGGNSSNHTLYTIYVKNLVSGEKFIVSRRFSDFYNLRKQILTFISWGHCTECTKFAEMVSSYPFPRKHFLRSNLSTVVNQRKDSLAMFLRYIINCSLNGTFSSCEQANLNIKNCILKSFLEIEEHSLVSKVACTSGSLPKSNRNDLERITSATISKLVRSSSDSGAYRSTHIGGKGMGNLVKNEDPKLKLGVDRRKFAANTCHVCLQNWTECYCDGDKM